jgi:hypothetical protein
MGEGASHGKRSTAAGLLAVASAFVLCSSALTRGGDLLWPTDASRAISSSFAEYRSNHFHAGIDIKTWGQTGYRVFAVAPGYIWKVRVSPFGYGKVIYQVLNDGGMAVYAHLSRFAPEIERRVRAEQQRLLRYSVTLEFRAGEIPVQAGELIAYTGDTGVGYPHLHFELRDAANRPLNPMLRGLVVADHVAPRVSSVAFVPVASWSRVDGDVKARIYRPISVGPNRYRIAEVPAVWGPFYLAVCASDGTDEATNEVGLYGFRLYANGKLLFSSRYDRFSYENTSVIVLDRDYRLRVRTDQVYYRLFIDPENNLPFYGQGRGAGVIWVGQRLLPGKIGADSWLDRITEAWLAGPGVYDLEIVAYDFNGNESVVEAQLEARPPDKGSLMEANSARRPGVLSSGSLEVDWLEDFARLGLGDCACRVRVAMEDVEYPLEVERSRTGECFAVWMYPRKERLSGEFLLSVGDQVLHRHPFEMYRVGDRSQEIKLTDPSLEVTIPARASYRPFYLGVVAGNGTQRNAANGSFPRVRVFPEDVPLRKPMRIAWYLGREMGVPPDKLAWYSLLGSTWVFLGNERDGSRLSAETSRLGTFAILPDTIPPEIAFLRPSQIRPRLSRRDTIVVRIADRLSGIADEDDFALEIDGERVVAEWDPEEEVLRYEPERPLSVGRHHLRVWVRDRCGNRAEKSLTFEVVTQ